MSAHQRAVDETAIDDAVGLKALGGEYVYIGCVSGDYLDNNVNQERNAFIFDSDEARIIKRSLVQSIMGYLHDYVEEIKEKKRKSAKKIIYEYPQFMYLQGEMEEFVSRLAPGAVSKEQVFVEMCRDRFRKTSAANRDMEKTLKNSAAYNGEIKAQLAAYQNFVESQQQGVLAEYVMLRKSTIDVLEKYIGFRDDGEGNYLEEAIHKLIVPMRTDSSKLEINDHQLWLLDERLSFFAFFASDKTLKSYTDVASTERPDVAFFYDTCFAWQSQAASNTVVLIEFKRPGRNNYNGEDNPIRQLIGYIRKIKTSSSLLDAKGRVFSPRLQSAAFHCYVVADITDTLRDSMNGLGYIDTPDGEGLILYTRNPDAFIEVVSYSKLLNDAKMKNSIFFEKLGLSDIDPSNPSDVEDAISGADETDATESETASA